MKNGNYSSIIQSEVNARNDSLKGMALFATAFVVSNTVTRCIINDLNRRARLSNMPSPEERARLIAAYRAGTQRE